VRLASILPELILKKTFYQCNFLSAHKRLGVIQNKNAFLAHCFSNK
jgi:hypothetical protein